MQQITSKLMILLFGVSIFFFTGCKKEVAKSPAPNPSVSHANPSSEKSVHIKATFTPDNFPNVSGTFVASGALGNDIHGDATMQIGGLTPFGNVAHCIVVLTFFDSEHDVTGTITIKQECQFSSTNPYPDAKGQWQIVSGTGVYEGLRGNGVTTMPPPFDEDMVGVIL